MKFFAYLICYFIYPFSFLFVRNKKKLAFGSFRNSFNDNSKYLFIYCQSQRKDLNSAWLSMSRKTVDEIRSKGLVAFHTISPKGIWHALTSKYWFFNAYSSDIMFALSGTATCINLWHGVGIKRIEFNIISGKLADRYKKRKFKEVFFHPESFKRPDWVLTSTPFQTKMFSPAFRIPENRCMELGYPRNWVLVCDENKRREFIDTYESDAVKSVIATIGEVGFKKVFIYMPTWRDSQRDIFIQSFDLAKMNEVLKEQQSLLLLKPHVNSFIDKSAVQGFSNIMLVEAGTDVYSVLPYTDVLITDYSSIIYDYILMEGKDVILYLYDYDDYVKDRDFFYPFDENVVGKRVMDFESLCECVSQGSYAIDVEEKDRLVRKFWGDLDATSVCPAILSLHSI